MKDLPFVSILMLVYNQEKFVLDALTSLVSQKYKNFEIIISDDCSNDRTVKIINQFIEKNNIHCNVVFNVNDMNVGISKNFETAAALCSGEYILLAAGDDISSDNRLSSCINKFLENPNLAAVFSNLKVIDESGTVTHDYFQDEPIYCSHLSDVIAGKPIWSIGASLCFKKDLLDKFSGFVPGTYQEDGVLAYRALLLGGFEYIAEPLVFYRLHSSNASQNISLKRKIFFKYQDLHLIKNALKDTHEVMNINDHEIIVNLRYRYTRLKILNLFLSIRPFAKLAFFISSLLRKMALRR